MARNSEVKPVDKGAQDKVAKPATEIIAEDKAMKAAADKLAEPAPKAEPKAPEPTAPSAPKAPVVAVPGVIAGPVTPGAGQPVPATPAEPTDRQTALNLTPPPHPELKDK